MVALLSKSSVPTVKSIVRVEQKETPTRLSSNEVRIMSKSYRQNCERCFSSKFSKTWVLNRCSKTDGLENKILTKISRQSTISPTQRSHKASYTTYNEKDWPKTAPRSTSRLNQRYRVNKEEYTGKIEVSMDETTSYIPF